MDEFKKILSEINVSANKLLHLVDKRTKEAEKHIDSISDQKLKDRCRELLKKANAGSLSVEEALKEINDLKNASQD